MAKPTQRMVRVVSALAAGMILPTLSFSQMSTIAAESGPHMAVETPFATLPTSPDAAITSVPAKTMGNAAIFPIQPVQVSSPRQERPAHPFWDRENLSLFAISTAGAGADFYVTRSNLANGGRELNPIARAFTGSTPALAANFALETTGVVGISYFFHKTGHHKLERATSYVNISASAGAVLYGLKHR